MCQANFLLFDFLLEIVDFPLERELFRLVFSFDLIQDILKFLHLFLGPRVDLLILLVLVLQFLKTLLLFILLDRARQVPL